MKRHVLNIQDINIKILPADKGNVAVVIDSIMSNNNTDKHTTSTIPNIEQNTRDIISKYKTQFITEEKRTRPIVTSIESPVYNVTKYLQNM